MPPVPFCLCHCHVLVLLFGSLRGKRLEAEANPLHLEPSWGRGFERSRKTHDRARWGIKQTALDKILLDLCGRVFAVDQSSPRRQSALFPGAQEEGDEESDTREEEKETGAKARACSGRSVAAGLGRFRRQDRKSLDHHRRRQRHHHLCAVQIRARARFAKSAACPDCNGDGVVDKGTDEHPTNRVLIRGQILLDGVFRNQQPR
jgi:hypothetical protein